MNWSKYQKDIFEWHKNNRPGTFKGLTVNAVAGSGKTTTIVQAAKLVDTPHAAFLAFNKSIQTTLQPKLPDKTVATCHSFGLSGIRSNNPKVKIETRKLDYITRDIIPDYSKQLRWPVQKIIGYVKGNLLEPTATNILDIAEYHGMELNGSSNQIVDYVQRTFQRSLDEYWRVDFDDMISLPYYLNLPLPQYDYLAVDELQDLNPAQHDLINRAISKDGIIVGVGDIAQSIYGFRGADVYSIPNFINRFQCDQLPLPISYRAPLEVVKLVNQTFPELLFEGADNAIQGEIKTGSLQRIDFIPGDMILCRVNAKLVAPCLSLIRRGIKAIIKGQDIGKNLVSLIKKMKSNDINDLFAKLDDYLYVEKTKLLASGKNMQAQALEDKIETIVAIADGCTTIDDIINRIETVFSDEVAAVTFSTVHKAKGLESNNVYIIAPELMPHPMAKKSWEVQQERNIQYVAYTRALQTLIFLLS